MNSFFHFKFRGDIGSMLVFFALVTAFLFFLRFCGIIPKPTAPIHLWRFLVGMILAFLIVIFLVWLKHGQCPLLLYPMGMDIGSILFFILAVILLFGFLWLFGLIEKATFQKTDFLTAIFTAGSVAIAAWAVIRTDQTQYEMKRIDLLTDYHNRYDKLVYEDKYHVSSKQEADDYYRRFWDLIYEEFSSWRRQFIDPDPFSDWMRFQKNEWYLNPYIGTNSNAVDYQTGWTNAMVYQDDAEFSNFMVHVFNRDEKLYTNGPRDWQNYLQTNSASQR